MLGGSEHSQNTEIVAQQVLITGISGMAGSHLADFILANQPDCKIYGVKRWRSSAENIAHIADRLEIFTADLTDASACNYVIERTQPDLIFHLAAQSFVPESWISPCSTITGNILMQANLFEAVRRQKLDPLIQVALSSEQYGRVYPDELPITEANRFRPLSPYAVSKVGQDMLAYQYFESYGLKIVRTRAFNHEGPRRGEVFVTSNFAKQIAEIEAGLSEPVIKVGNLDARRDWSDVRDVVRAYWLALDRCTPGEDYIIASGRSRSVKEMLDQLLSLSKVKIEVKNDPCRMRPSDVMLLEGDASKFKAKTGWEPQFTFEQTLKDLLNYWREKVSSGSSARAGQKARA